VDRWPDRLPAATVIRDVPCLADGFVRTIDGEALGLCVVRLGGGRQREGDKINPSVGLSELAGIGEQIGIGEPLCMVHAATEAQAEAAIAAVQAAYGMGDVAPADPALILKRVA
jgi:thymidine phosphorylase